MKLYRGIIIDNKDPNQSGRAQVRIFEIHGLVETDPAGNKLVKRNPNTKLKYVPDMSLPWAEVMQPIDFMGYSKDKKECKESYALGIDGTGSKEGAKTIEYADKNPGTGYNRILGIGTWVFCVLENGNPNYPIIIGAIASKNEYTASKAYRVYDSIAGHYEEFNDEEQKIIIHHLDGSEIVMQQDCFGINASTKLNIFANEDAAFHTESNFNAYIKKDTQLTIEGGLTEKVTKDISIEAKGYDMEVQTRASIKASSSIALEADGNIQVKASGPLTLEGSMVKIN
jgi:hypothetical protein